ncbi:MAG: hypothetical protein ACRDN0_31740, partial [Trebonia sp.]
GLGTWFAAKAPSDVKERLTRLQDFPVGRSQLNQLLHLCHEPGVSAGFFEYYWTSAPTGHPFDATRVEECPDLGAGENLIRSPGQLRWGLRRIVVDALLYFGDVRTAFRSLRAQSRRELEDFFAAKRFEPDEMASRGPALELIAIPRDDRYLIAEMACKSFGVPGKAPIRDHLLESLRAHRASGGGRITVRELIAGPAPGHAAQGEFQFSAGEILDESVGDEGELVQKLDLIALRFEKAREAALRNTRYFLSMVNDLDVYVATSMRTRADFRKVGEFCERLFRDQALQGLRLRYFDPTVSAAAGHEDKGLIECLMVKSAKVLVYCAGDADSFGKDAEAAMALSLGKPVIFFCEEAQRKRFFDEVHPLSRLIDFRTGVAVGAMVTARENDAVELLGRIFRNRVEYTIEDSDAALRLRESITQSVVRLQTKDPLLRETFWNYYHGRV